MSRATTVESAKLAICTAMQCKLATTQNASITNKWYIQISRSIIINKN